MPLAITALLQLINQIDGSAHDPKAVAAATDELRQALIAAEQDPVTRLHLSVQIERERIVPVSVAALLRGCSPDTIEKFFADKIIRTGGKIKGIRIKDVLELEDTTSVLPKPRKKKAALVTARKRRHGQGAGIPKRRRISTPAASPPELAPAE